MPPNEFVRSRKSNSTSIVDERPYYPNLRADHDDHESLFTAALKILYHDSKPPSGLKEKLSIRRVVGGNTNILFCISGLTLGFDSVLVRIFGAQGMIDRDVETSTYASLAKNGVAPPYYGRGENYRLEGWLENHATLCTVDLQSLNTSSKIAVEMAKLHYGFHVPIFLNEWHDEKKPAMWLQLSSWMNQAKKIEKYKSQGDDIRAKRLVNLDLLEIEFHWVKQRIPKDAKCCFCHNDLLAANIVQNCETNEIRLIDFEYGGINYIAFDIANHFNEYGGGTDRKDGVPDYSLFPDKNRQKNFIESYVRTKRSLEKNEDNHNMTEEDEILALHKTVNAFILVNHLYWGLWAVNQGAIEGTDGFDYLAYAYNRFLRYNETKNDL